MVDKHTKILSRGKMLQIKTTRLAMCLRCDLPKNLGCFQNRMENKI